MEGPYCVLYSDDLGRWLPGVDPKGDFERNDIRTWKENFPLKGYELLKARQW